MLSASPLELTSSRIDVWYCMSEEIDRPELRLLYDSWMTAEERAKVPRFHFERDRILYIATRGLVRWVLSRYLASEPSTWRFAPGPYGRPQLLTTDPTARSLVFNLSHSKGLVTCAVTRSSVLGVDVEATDRERVPVDIADSYFSPAEVADLKALPQAERPMRFLEYWTLKESYIKAEGKGLSIPLDSFSFDLRSPNGVSISFKSPAPEEGPPWQFWLLAPTNDHMLALTLRRLVGTATEVVVRRSIPAIEEEITTCPVLRSSAGKAGAA